VTARRAAVLALGILLATGTGTPASADDPGAQRRWQDLSPRERGEAYRNYQRFQKMPPEQRRQVERNYDRWQKLPPQEKERLRSNYRQYREMPPERRRELDRRGERRGR
jgi:hypothetical protein